MALAPNDRQSKLFLLMGMLPSVEDVALLRDAVQTVGADIPDERMGDRMAIVRIGMEFLMGGVFTGLEDDVAIEAMDNTLNMLRGPQNPGQQGVPGEGGQNQHGGGGQQDAGQGDNVNVPLPAPPAVDAAAAVAVAPDNINNVVAAAIGPAPVLKAESGLPMPTNNGNDNGNRNLNNRSVNGNQNQGQGQVPLFRIQRLNELKIKGTIGMPNETGMLDFRNLSYQIQNAKDRGYEDAEICSAVVQSIKAGVELRGFLEGDPNLNLATVIKRLRLHFKVKDAANAFLVMERTTQGPKESEETYCHKMLRLRQDVEILSKQEKNSYNEDHIRKRFQHAFYTGLRNEAVRQQLKPMLKGKELISDDALLEELSDIMLAEAEHLGKLEEQNQKDNDKSAASCNSLSSSGGNNKSKSDCDSQKAFLAHITKLHTEQMEHMTKLTDLIVNNCNVSNNGGPSELRGVDNSGGQRNVGDNLGNEGGVSRGDGGSGQVVPRGGGNPQIFRGGQLGGGAQNVSGNNIGNTAAGAGGVVGRGGARSRGFRTGFCIDCADANIRYCEHCFLCGSTEHKKPDCPLNPKNN